MRSVPRSLLQSFHHAYLGLVHVWLTQRNMRVHFAAGYLVLVLASWLDFDALHTLALLLTVGAVVVAELFNTAVEATVDLVGEAYHPKAKIAKDVAAAAVLATSVLSIVVAVYLFGPELARFPAVVVTEWSRRPAAVSLHFIIFAFLLLSSPGVQDD